VTDDEFLSLAYSGIGEGFADEVEPMIVPAFTALLSREVTGKQGSYTETMWVQGYPSIKSVTITHPPVRLDEILTLPGVIRTIPLGARHVTDADTFRGKCEQIVAQYEGFRWVRRSHTIQGS
jgi:hypothetical protein